jgi:transcriptional regulator with GAF, ATPase, and Fis domain
VDVRVIAATNRDLLQEVRDKRFREDLYYRLNVFPVRLPPLRERRDDIPLLVHFLVNKFAQQLGKRLDGVGPETMRRLQDYPWPGNVRELENVLERAVILATGPTLEVAPDLLPAPAAVSSEASGVRSEDEGPSSLLTPHSSSQAPAPAPQAAGQPLPHLEDVERDYIVTVLRQTNWLITGPRGAAKILGLHANTLRNRMKKLGITRPAH